MDKKECAKIPMKIHGKTTVGPKGQVVIPKEVRDLLSLQPGDDLVVISKGDIAIGMIKSDDVEKVLKYMQQEMDN